MFNQFLNAYNMAGGVVKRNCLIYLLMFIIHIIMPNIFQEKLKNRLKLHFTFYWCD